MSNLNTTVIICCAGMGTRLGIGTTKALMHINGKALIIHQLEALKDFDDVRIVVGYQANRVIEIVNKYRKDVMFAFNNDYKTTGPAASLSKGLINTREYVLMMDGDILINPDDFKSMLDIENEFLAISKKNSSEPVLVKVDENNAIKFCKGGNYEWPGIARIKSEKITKGHDHVFNMIDKILPLPTYEMRSMDIDTPEDFENAIKWANNNFD